MEHTEKLYTSCFRCLEDKLAQEVVALDVASLTPVVAEYFVDYTMVKRAFKQLSMPEEAVEKEGFEVRST